MLSNAFTVDADWIGNWDGEEEHAAIVWNMWIAPALLALEERLGDVQQTQVLAEDQFRHYVTFESLQTSGQRVASFIDKQ